MARMGGFVPADHHLRHEIGGRDEVNKIIRKTADQIVNNSTTLVSDLELLFAVGAGEIWLLTLFLRAISATTTPDIDYAYSVPSGASILRFFFGTPASPSAEASATTEQIRQVTAGITVSIERSFYIGGTTAGNIQLKWAQNVATAEDTTVKANSVIIAHRLA